MLAALGLLGTSSACNIGPCLDFPAPPIDTSDSGDTADTGDTGLGPCLDYAFYEGDSHTDGDPGLKSPDKAGVGQSDAVESLLERSDLPPDIAERIKEA